MESGRQLRANETNQGAAMRLHVKLWNEQNSEKNIPSLSVIQTSGGNPNGQQYDQNSTEWNEEQEEVARREAYKLHEKKHRNDVHSQHRCLVPRDGSSQTAHHLFLGTQCFKCHPSGLGIFRWKTAAALVTRHTETAKPDGTC